MPRNYSTARKKMVCTDQSCLIKVYLTSASVKERKKLLEWLASQSGINFDEDHDRIFKRRHQDTGNWLVEDPQFINWCDGDESGLLWCHGSRKKFFPLR